MVVSRVRAHGGLVSFKNEVDGTQRPYELNINYYDALNDPNVDEPLDTQIERFVTAHAILLAVRGVPAIYFHSLVGSRGWLEGALTSGQNRTINRRKLHKWELSEWLSDPASRSARVFQRLGQLLKIRQALFAFHPYGSQEVIQHAPEIFGLLRTSPDGKDKVLCLQNVSGQDVQINSLQVFHKQMRDLISDQIVTDNTSFTLRPYQTLWLAKSKD
jgi:hypothetical protein